MEETAIACAGLGGGLVDSLGSFKRRLSKGEGLNEGGEIREESFMFVDDEFPRAVYVLIDAMNYFSLVMQSVRTEFVILGFCTFRNVRKMVNVGKMLICMKIKIILIIIATY